MSDLQKILFNLRDSGIIDENNLILILEEIKNTNTKQILDKLPFIDIFGVVSINKEIQILRSLINEIEKEIQISVKKWEQGDLERDQAKEIIEKHVQKKNFHSVKLKQLKYRLNLKLNRLSNIETENDLDLEDYINQINSVEFSTLKNVLKDFNKIWQEFSLKSFYSEDLTLDKEILDEVEQEILESLQVPIKDESDVFFDLEGKIKPFELKEGKSSIISQTIPEPEGFPESEQLDPKPIDAESPEHLIDTWGFVGKIAFDEEETPLGLFRPPVRVAGQIYLPMVQEKPLSITKLKEKYSNALKDISIDLKTTTTQELTEIISNALEVPEKIALVPSIFNQWVFQVGLEISPIKPVLTKAWFIEEEELKDTSVNHPIIRSEALKVIKIPAWIPAPGRVCTNESIVGAQVVGMAGSNFGKIIDLINVSPYGQAVVIERELPPTNLLDIYMEGLAKQNIADLRFSIAKKLKIGEGAVFSSENLWAMNNLERLLVSPHDILMSFYCILPASAFHISNQVKAKTGVYFHSISETFKYLIGKQFTTQENKTGIIYGFTIDERKVYLLGTFKHPEEIIREIGRKSSPQYIQRFQKRVSLALGIPYSESLQPSNLARYFLNFIWIEEDLSLSAAIRIIERQFSLIKIPFSDITSLQADGIECNLLHG